jgi:hypothetical protein
MLKYFSIQLSKGNRNEKIESDLSMKNDITYK